MGHSYDGKERRRHVRIPKNYSLFFKCKDSSLKESDTTLIKNISKGGLRFTTSQPIKPGTQLVFEITIPYIAPRRLIVEGVVITCNEIAPRIVYEIRAKFNPLDEETSQIFEMIEKGNLKGQ